MEIRTLRPADDRSAFDSGDEVLDRFFHRYAGQNQFRHQIGVTYVAVDSSRILGFATIAPRHVDIDGLPEGAQKRLPRSPLPVLGSPDSPSTGRPKARGSARSCSSSCSDWH
jgi:hypothetical protein